MEGSEKIVKAIDNTTQQIQQVAHELYLSTRGCHFYVRWKESRAIALDKLALYQFLDVSFFYPPEKNVTNLLTRTRMDLLHLIL